MIAFLVVVYTSVVAVLFKFKLLKPRSYPIAPAPTLPDRLPWLPWSRRST